jgi:hypothetical protein
MSRSAGRHRLRAPVIVLELAFPPSRSSAFYHSFTHDGLTSTWIGLGNYERLFGDPTFWRIVLNNLFLLAAVPIAILIPLLVAYLLNEHVAGWQFFRSAYFLPTAISGIIAGRHPLRRRRHPQHGLRDDGPGRPAIDAAGWLDERHGGGHHHLHLVGLRDQHHHLHHGHGHARPRHL